MYHNNKYNKKVKINKLKIATVIGARPQFVKAAIVSRVLNKNHEEIVIHTGQHYDSNMSDIFFSELNMEKPKYQLGVGSGSHAVQTAKMMIGIEEILLKEKPEYLLLYGDTNSTIAGALAASKILIPIAHVEAGLRSFNMNMPEEQNRIVTDKLSELLFCPTMQAVDNLANEGIKNGVHCVGDVMCDAVLSYASALSTDSSEYINRLQPIFSTVLPSCLSDCYLATIHRAENTDDISKIREILSAFEQLDAPVIFPVHPRVRNMVDSLNNELSFKNILFVEPVGYSEMLFFTKNAKKVITDSGGLQKESYILKTPCVTVRDQTEWTETLNGGYNILAKPNTKDILSKVFDTITDKDNYSAYYGDGHAAEKICDLL